MRKLVNLAKSRNVEATWELMFNDEKMNFTENRAVLHVALWSGSNTSILVDGKDEMPEVNRVMGKMNFSANTLEVLTGRGTQASPSQTSITLSTLALTWDPSWLLKPSSCTLGEGPRAWSVSINDGTHIAKILATMNSESSLFIITSKTFTIRRPSERQRSGSGFSFGQGSFCYCKALCCPVYQHNQSERVWS